MLLNLHITFADKTEKTVTAIAADLVAFEEKFDMSVTRLDREARLTHFMFLAYSVELRNKETAKSFDEWLPTIESVELTDSKK